MKLTNQEKQILAHLAGRLKADFHAEKVILFGSAVRDELDGYSDIDLLVVLPEVNWEIEKQIIGLCFEAELECGRVISTTCLSRAELTGSPLKESPFVQNVQKQGKEL